jgi:hypothetical protein
MKVLLRNPRRQLDGAPAIARRSLAEQGALGACERCGGPMPSAVCAFCRLVERTGR